MASAFAMIHDARDLGADERDVLVSQIREQGFRELAAASIFAAAIRLAPSLDEKVLLVEHAREDLVHFEWVSAIHEDLGAGDLLASVQGPLASVPEPRSWLELVVAQFLFERAARLALSSQRACRYSPYVELVSKLLRAEAVHEAMAEVTFGELCETDATPIALRQTHFDTWLRVAVRALALGFQFRDSHSLVRAFYDALVPSARRFGVALPGDPNLLLLDGLGAAS